MRSTPHRRSLRLLGALAVLGANLGVTTSASAEPLNLDGLGAVYLASLITIPTVVFTTFAAPAAAQREGQSYAAGVGFTAIGAIGGAAAGLAVGTESDSVAAICIAPPVGALVLGIAAAVIWSSVSPSGTDGKASQQASFSAAVVPLEGGALAAAGGTFSM